MQAVVQKDLGAHFKKCDLQIHTARDANWSGPLKTIPERVAFAEALIADCRRKGIEAIAITDHHDLCMWRFIHNASLAEKRSDGSALSEDKRLVVFPGVELTLSNPDCQAILILDPDLSDATLAHIWGGDRYNAGGSGFRKDGPDGPVTV